MKDFVLSVVLFPRWLFKPVEAFGFSMLKYVSLRLRVQNAVPAQPCVGKLGISLVLLNFLHCNFRLWFKILKTFSLIADCYPF